MNPEIYTVLVSNIAILWSVYGVSVPHSGPARFSISSIFETAVPAAIHPLIAAGSDRCKYTSNCFALKNLTKTTYNCKYYVPIDMNMPKASIQFSV